MRVSLAVVCSILLLVTTVFAAEKTAKRATTSKPTTNQTAAPLEPELSEASDSTVWESFRGLKWGDDIKLLPGAVLLSDLGDGTTIYARQNEDLTLGAVKLERVIYVFSELSKINRK